MCCGSGQVVPRRSAERANPEAQVQLAQMLSKGEGVAQDYAEARRCEAAGKQRYAMADYRLGQIYRNGLGVQKDLGAAKKWYEKAAQRGDGPAMLQLGDTYQDGDGVMSGESDGLFLDVVSVYSEQPRNAEKETELLKREMSEKAIGKAKEKAADFLRSWPSAVRISAAPQLH